MLVLYPACGLPKTAGWPLWETGFQASWTKWPAGLLFGPLYSLSINLCPWRVFPACTVSAFEPYLYLELKSGEMLRSASIRETFWKHGQVGLGFFTLVVRNPGCLIIYVQARLTSGPSDGESHHTFQVRGHGFQVRGLDLQAVVWPAVVFLKEK